MLTLLEIITTVVNETGSIAAPSTVVGNTDNTVKQLLALANREGKELAAMSGPDQGWPVLRKEYQLTLNTVTGLSGATTSGSAVITGISSTASLAAGYALTGTGIPVNTHIVTVDSATQVTVDYPATETGTPDLTFAQDAYAFPTDIQYWINQTGWNRTSHWQLGGPMTPQEWQFCKSGYPGSQVYYRFRVMANKIYFDPPPTSEDYIAFEYYSKNWCQSSGGTAQALFAADTDTPILDDQAMILGIKWRFLRSKGFDYQEEKRQYEDSIERLIARAGMGRDLPLSSAGGSFHLIDYSNVADGGYG